MRVYFMDEVSTLFHIDPVTLRRWLRRQHVTTHVDPADRRRRYLDHSQLLSLADAHKRIVVEMPSADVRLEELFRRVECIESFLSLV